MKGCRGYIFSRNFMGERVPQAVQNIVIRDYCRRRNITYLLSSAEYSIADSHYILRQILNEITEVDGIVMYSMFQLPESQTERAIVYCSVIKANRSLHFALEDLMIDCEGDIERIENIWQVKSVLYRQNGGGGDAE